MEVWRKIISYITFRKQESPTGESEGFTLKAMHTINKISIFMFLIAMVILLVKLIG